MSSSNQEILRGWKKVVNLILIIIFYSIDIEKEKKPFGFGFDEKK